MQDMKKVIEAALFTASSPLTVKDLERVCRVYNPVLVQGKARELLKEFNTRNSSLKIVELENGFKMKVREPEEEKVTHLAAGSLFSKGELKTLAYVAYKQPVRQSSVVKARNTRAYEELKKLEQEKFIKRERKGSTYILTLAPKFHKHFGEEALRVLKKGEEELAPGTGQELEEVAFNRSTAGEPTTIEREKREQTMESLEQESQAEKKKPGFFRRLLKYF